MQRQHSNWFGAASTQLENAQQRGWSTNTYNESKGDDDRYSTKNTGYGGWH